MSKNDGGPAFPPVHDPDSHPSGMTLRDYFAAKVMQGLVMNAGSLFSTASFAVNAYAMADAMLKAREQ